MASDGLGRAPEDSDSLRELHRTSGSLKRPKRDLCRAERSLEDLKRVSKVFI